MHANHANKLFRAARFLIVRITINIIMGKEISAYSYNETLSSNKNQPTTAKCKNMDEPPKDKAEHKKPMAKELVGFGIHHPRKACGGRKKRRKSQEMPPCRGTHVEEHAHRGYRDVRKRENMKSERVTK